MADAYQSLNASGDIGALLRMIQEEKANSILNAPPSVESGSPIRDVATGPILSPESPSSNRISSIRPEGGVSATDGVAPVSPVGPIVGQGGSPVGPVAPVRSMPGNAGQIPTGTLLSNRPSSLPSIGTSIKSAPKPTPSPVFKSTISAPKPASVTPKRSTTGTIIAKKGDFQGAREGVNTFDKAIQKLRDLIPGSNLKKITPKSWYA